LIFLHVTAQTPTTLHFSPSEQLRNIPVASDLTVDARAANLIAINFWPNLDQLRCYRSDRIVS